MKPPPISLQQVTALPMLMRTEIPESYRDENGHMNMRWYLALFDDAGYPLVAQFGITTDYNTEHGTGGFDLEHHLHYLNEVHIGDTVAIYSRVIGRSAKRIHYMMFLVNETRGNVAATFECVNSFADLTQRRTAPYPAEIAARIDAVLERDSRLEWQAPTCGVMSA